MIIVITIYNLPFLLRFKLVNFSFIYILIQLFKEFLLLYVDLKLLNIYIILNTSHCYILITMEIHYIQIFQ